ncbi:MAG: hypothetical protein ACJ71O_02165, partial [Nitrososphaeraceae archaeon]
MNPELDDSLSTALLSKTEIRWLRNDIKVSKSFEYKIKSSIKKKVQILTELELPLLVKNNFFVNDDSHHHEINDDSILGRDLEWGPPLSYPPNDTALVRQRSRVQIPAKALLFCKKGEELGFLRSNETLPKTVRILPNLVRPRQRSTRLSYQLAPRDYQYQSELSDCTINEEFWTEFEEYLLKNHNKQTTKHRIFYSKKYYHILTSQVNARELLLLSDQKRMHVMKALATLSKYLGCYDKWKDIKERYQLKWSNEDSLETFSMFTNGEQNYNSMME